MRPANEATSSVFGPSIEGGVLWLGWQSGETGASPSRYYPNSRQRCRYPTLPRFDLESASTLRALAPLPPQPTVPFRSPENQSLRQDGALTRSGTDVPSG